ncbi:MAG: hypothetical protein K9H65_01225 [Bacteroidales bacterium]|nr:hypothetical protein [Bacteroidales bacterium]
MQNRSLFKYSAFGLNIQSDIEIPEMKETAFNRPDVTVILAETPGEIENPMREGVCFQLTETEFLLNVDNIARYYVADGNSIRIEKRNGSSFQEVRLFLLEVVFAALLHQKGMVPFRASALLDERGKGFLLCGRSGVGKSTLTAYFLNMGFRLLSDNVSVVSSEQGKIWVYPSYPFIKLWKDVMEDVDYTPEEGIKLRDPLEKYGYRIEEAFYSEHVSLEKVFVLHVHNKEEYKTEKLEGPEKFNALKNQTFRFQFLTKRTRSHHFILLNEMSQALSVMKVTRPQAPIESERLYKVIRRLF